jgi:MFS family permease
MVEGPLSRYDRTVEVRPHESRLKHHSVVETIDYKADIPYWGALLHLPLRWGVARHRRFDGRQPKWAPPHRLSHRAASILATLAIASLLGGFLSNTQGEMLTYAAEEFDRDTSAQGLSSAITRIGTVLALGAAFVADRKGRRLVLGVSMVAGIISASLIAIAPSFALLTAGMALTRMFNSALAAAVFLLAMEEMPSGSRAFCLAILAMPAGLGAGMVVWVEPIADLSPTAWRWVFAVPLLLLPFVAGLLRRLPESRRFATRSRSVNLRPYVPRIILLGSILFLISLFLAPIDQFRNEYLRDEHNFTAKQVSILILSTATPGSVALLFWGRLSDTVGRRIVIGIASVAGLGLIVVFFNSSGLLLYPMGFGSVLLSVGLLSSVGVYKAEMFPTNVRAKAGAIVSIIGVSGSVVGLIAMGRLVDRWGSFGPVVALFWIAPLLAMVIVVAGLREGSRRELEELNPEDAQTTSPPQS